MFEERLMGMIQESKKMVTRDDRESGTNFIKIGLPVKLILSRRKVLPGVLFSGK